jgi:hypothetical protein
MRVAATGIHTRTMHAARNGEMLRHYRSSLSESFVSIPMHDGARAAHHTISAFSSESLPRTWIAVDTGSRDENASKQESGALVLIQSEPKLQRTSVPRSSAAATRWRVFTLPRATFSRDGFKRLCTEVLRLVRDRVQRSGLPGCARRRPSTCRYAEFAARRECRETLHRPVAGHRRDFRR